MPDRINLYEPPHTPGDETIEEIARRVDRLIRAAGAAATTAQTVCCVSHGDPIVIAHALYRRLPLAARQHPHGLVPAEVLGHDAALRETAPAGRPSTYRDVIGELAPELKAPTSQATARSSR